MSEANHFKDKFWQEVYTSLAEKIRIGAINVPSDYSLVNALQSSLFILKDMKTGKDDGYKPIIDHCTKDSIADSLFRMVSEGLNPAKKQCSFIPRGKKLCYQREYQGDKALAKRYSNVKAINHGVIYEGDKFVTERDKMGNEILIKHDQPIENLDNPIKAAYCIIVEEDGTPVMEKMTRKMIQRAWDYPKMKTFKGYKEGTMNDTQTNFEDQMCIKTVVKRACKPYINSSTDENIMPEIESVSSAGQLSAPEIVPENKQISARKEEIPDAQVVEDNNQVPSVFDEV